MRNMMRRLVRYEFIRGGGRRGLGWFFGIEIGGSKKIIYTLINNN
jgi:hypothetical protein